jgi:hypothetical protein
MIRSPNRVNVFRSVGQISGKSKAFGLHFVADERGPRERVHASATGKDMGARIS